jgi:hypothetical protein
MAEEKKAIDIPQVGETDSDSDIQVADIIHVHATPEQEARVLKKIDRLYKTPMDPIELRLMGG